MEHWELSARESIRDLVARYNANGDAGRLDEVLALFSPDAVMELPGRRLEGLNAIRAMFEDATRRTSSGTTGRFIRHFTATLQIDIESEHSARSRAYYVVFTDGGPDHWGRYVDRYERVGGTWRFAERKVSVDAAIPGGWGAAEG